MRARSSCRNCSGGDVERVLLQDPADDHLRVRAQDVHHHGRTEPVEFVGADHDVLEAGGDVVQPALVLDDVVDAGKVLERPFHVRPQPGQAELLLAVAEHVLDQRQHGVLVESSFAQIGALPGADLELTRPLGRVHVDPEAADPPAPLVAMTAIDDLKDLVALPKTLLHEGQQQPIFLFRVVKERAGMATVPHRRACQCHGPASLPIAAALDYCCGSLRLPGRDAMARPGDHVHPMLRNANGRFVQADAAIACSSSAMSTPQRCTSASGAVRCATWPRNSAN